MTALHDAWRPHVRPEHFDWTCAILTTLYWPKASATQTRVYHSIEHIEACLDRLESLHPEQPEGRIDKSLASLALIFHDAVYVAGQPDNEKNSAALLEGLRFTLREEERAARAVPLILATAHKAQEGAFGDVTLAAVVDIDLSILGEDEAAYRRYVGSIRCEFAHVSDEAWRVGRGGFLAQMLARKRIYTLGVMRARYEERARQNMEAELTEGGVR
jgi:predicted metal-dependent HD superfamily phosphohydrolase